MPNGSFSLPTPNFLLQNFGLPENENLFEFNNRIKVSRFSKLSHNIQAKATRVKRTVDLITSWNLECTAISSIEQ